MAEDIICCGCGRTGHRAHACPQKPWLHPPEPTPPKPVHTGPKICHECVHVDDDAQSDNCRPCFRSRARPNWEPK